MKAFMKSLSPTSSTKEKLITDNLVNKLSESVKYIQMNESGDEVWSLINGDGSTALCTVLEAIFLHGLKDSIVQIATKALTSDVDQRPEPSFWSLLLVFSHKQIINSIESLQQVTTEVGYCRAWIRIALNDNLLSSYLSSMQRDSHVLKQFYKQHAFVRDTELLDVAKNLINGIEPVASFDLAINSSLLNYWSDPPLIMAGIWSPSLKSCPIPSGVDIASSIDASKPAATPTQSLEPTATTGIGQLTALNEGEALRIILQKSSEIEDSLHIDDNNRTDPTTSDATISTAAGAETSSPLESSAATDTTNSSSGFGNSLSGACGWSFETRESPVAVTVTKQPEKSADGKPLASSTPERFSEVSYNAIVDNYNVNYNKTMPFKWPMDNEEPTEEQNGAAETNKKRFNPNDSLLKTLGYEVISSSINSVFSTAEFNKYVSLLGQLPWEKGLDNQKYICATCGNTLGISFSKANVCAFTCEYFCDECMSLTLRMIPARIIFNWDFRKYPVSKRAETFLTEFKHHPLIDMKAVNPHIYSLIGKMAELQTLRVKLNFLRAYLYTCREPVIEQLQRKVWPREYIYESIHQYSISDLEQIPQNLLVNQLRQIVAFAREHVSTCWLCSQKGFICEVCNAPKVLYPFDLETTYRCGECNSVYHRECLEISSSCPKCVRKIRREDMPYINAADES